MAKKRVTKKRVTKKLAHNRIAHNFNHFREEGPDSDYQGEYFDKVISFTLEELFTLDPDELKDLLEERVGTDEMGGLAIGFESLVDADTISLRVRGTVDAWADGSPPPGVTIENPASSESLNATEKRLKIRRRDAVKASKAKK